MNKLDQVRTWIKRYGLQNVILRGAKMILPIQRIANNKKLRTINWQSYCKKKLKKHLVFKEKENIDNSYSKTIWWLWFQGKEQAPLIVKKCYESISKYSKEIGFNLVELNKENLRKYVQFPERIWELWEKGCIMPAHFSDMCRINLLAFKGGMGIDSTVMLTGKINNEILNSDMFFYRASFLDLSETQISNWFLYSKNSGESFFLSLYYSMENWWLHNKTVNDYFIFHLFAALLIESGKFERQLYEMPYYSNTYPTLLQHELKKTFSSSKFDSIKCKTNVHKLTYKNLEGLKNDTFYHVILNYNLEELDSGKVKP